MVETCRAMLGICWYDTGAHVYKHERHVAILHGMPPFCLVQCPVMRKYQSLQSLLAVSCSKVDFDIAQLWASTLVPSFCYSLSVADAGRYYGSAVLLPKRSALRPLAPVVSSADPRGVRHWGWDFRTLSLRMRKSLRVQLHPRSQTMFNSYPFMVLWLYPFF